jgi:hypothetical protein
METEPCGLWVHQVRLVADGGVRLVLALVGPAPRAKRPSTGDKRLPPHQLGGGQNETSLHRRFFRPLPPAPKGARSRPPDRGNRQFSVPDAFRGSSTNRGNRGGPRLGAAADPEVAGDVAQCTCCRSAGSAKRHSSWTRSESVKLGAFVLFRGSEGRRIYLPHRSMPGARGSYILCRSAPRSRCGILHNTRYDKFSTIKNKSSWHVISRKRGSGGLSAFLNLDLRCEY